MNFKIKFKKRLFYPVLISSILLGGYLYATPYLSIIGFKSAVESRDTETARKYINFISVRRSLKDQLSETLSKRIALEIEDEPLKGLRMLIIGPMVHAIVDSTIDATVTPNGLNVLLNSGELSKQDSSNVEVIKPKSKSKVRLYYKTINRFVLRSDIPDIEEPMKAYWKRDGITHWKLTSIELPFELMSNLR